MCQDVFLQACQSVQVGEVDGIHHIATASGTWPRAQQVRNITLYGALGGAEIGNFNGMDDGRQGAALLRVEEGRGSRAVLQEVLEHFSGPAP